MQQVRAAVLWGYGINCERETALSLKKAGCDEVKLVHINELLEGEVEFSTFNIFFFPGGFLDGDHMGAAKACANRFMYGRVKKTGKTVFQHILDFIERGGYVIGVCNGFQLLVKMGLLPALEGNYGEIVLTLASNDSGRFEDRWVYLKVPRSKSPMFEGFERLYLPVRHGEGKIIAKSREIIEKLFLEEQVVLQYADPNFSPTMEYPYNPNGSEGSIAGVCDPTGKVVGLMPHPEAFHVIYNHPRWTRREKTTPCGVDLFRKLVNYIKERS